MVMTPRDRAIQIVKQLQAAGHSALWAGGCVRDALLKKEPKDYDVATSATPDQVQHLFGHKSTLAIGKSFGVITVLGPKSAGPIEVATFRRDGGYSDGRRPDSVEFTDAREDALRRDFTVNGMFFDPIEEQVIDYVGGKDDLIAKQIRAIGDPDARIEEDKLRMLRAVRFATTYDFAIEENTLKAIQKQASQISAVSPERIGVELRKMLGHANKTSAFLLLVETNLWPEISPATDLSINDCASVLSRLQSDSFATTVAAIFHSQPVDLDALQQAWRLTNQERDQLQWLISATPQLQNAQDLPWSQLQPWLISPHAMEGIQLIEALGDDAHKPSMQRCRDCLDWDDDKLNPAPLIDGKALMDAGMEPGPNFSLLIKRVRALQLDGEIATSEQAIRWATENVEGL